jgi:uncharacterized protein with ATP-grasp and redox domains
MTPHLLALPRPEPLRGVDPGSFAQSTVAQRIKDLARQTLSENRLPAAARRRLQALIDEIPQARLQPINDPGAPDLAHWAGYLAPYTGLDWLQVPFFVAEAYFYRRILAATGYFQPGPTQGLDPYRRQKRQALAAGWPLIRAYAARQADWLAAGGASPAALVDLFKAALWSNQADLSMWPMGSAARPAHADTTAQDRHLLADEAADAAAHLLAAGPGQVDFLLDNAGVELVGDLGLADLLLTTGAAQTIRFHLKPHPYFISDTTIQDVHSTVAALARQADPPTRQLARRLTVHLQTGRLALRPAWFWTAPLPFWEMPATLRTRLAPANLIISKGDANYRRLLGDSHWPYSTPLAAIVSYLPAPLLALRVLKSEVAAGTPAERLARLPVDEPNWLINGHWGVIQFCPACNADRAAA